MTWSTTELEVERTPPAPADRPRRRRTRAVRVALVLAAVAAAAPAAAQVTGAGSDAATPAATEPDRSPAPQAGAQPTIAPPAATAPTTTAPATTTAAPAATTTTLAPPAPLAAADGVATYAYGPGPLQVLDVRVGAPAAAPRPVLVYLHSGGWNSGSRVNLPDFVLAQVDRGWAVVALDFALAPAEPFPAPDADIDRALRWLDVHGPALGLADGPPVLLGTSSGGHLALAAAAHPGRDAAADLPPELRDADPSVAAVVAVAAPTDLADLLGQAAGWGRPAVSAYLGCDETCDPAVVAAATPALTVAPSPPPALLLHGELDTLAPADPSGARLVAAWAAAGGTATVVEAVGYGHNLGIDAGIDLAALEAFLDAATA